MISEYNIKNECTLYDYLKSNHLSNKYIEKLACCNAVSDKDNYLNKNSLLKSGDKIYINYSLLEENKEELYKYPIDVIYEDSEIIAVEKPRGILIHSDGNTNKTLLNAVCHYLSLKEDDSVVRCLHRIDFNTTGIVLFSKNIFSYSNINYQVEHLEVKKEYLTIVEGVVQNRNGEITKNIGRNRHDSRKYLVTDGGKSAYTKYEVLDYRGNKTLLKINITTGRTHQIRVHMSYMGHPVVGDELYGRKGDLMLHFFKVVFKLYDEEMIIKSNKVL